MQLSLGNYELLRKIGAGGMGEVYLAQHRRLGRVAAVKVLTRELSGSSEMLERFFAEAKTTSSIRHPGIVEVIDCDVAPGGSAFIVMELLEGMTLGKILEKRRPLPLSDLVSVAQQVAAAVGAAHGQGVVHRDLKPDNVFVVLDPVGRLKILDFGIAKLMGGQASGSGLTRTGRLMGTPQYMSPEQCRGAGKVDHRTDIYALGCIIFQMAAGVPPFEGDSMGDLIAAHLVQAPPSLAERAPQLPQGLVDLVAMMLMKDPEARPGTMAEVSARLADLRIGWQAEGSALRLTADDVHQGDPILETDLITLRQHLDSVVKAPEYGGTVVLPAAPVATRVLAPGAAPTTFSQSAGEVAQPPNGRGKAAWLWALGATAVVAAGLALVLLRPGAANTPAPASSPTVASTVRVDVENAPEHLQVTVNGRPSGLPVVLPRGPEGHALVFTADGMKTQTMTIDGSRDRTIRLDMVRELPAAPEQPVVAAPPVQPVIAAPPSSPSRSKSDPRAKKTKKESDVITDL